MPVYRPSELHKLGIQPKKRLSQNFLIDRNILEKICAAAKIQEGDKVLEIGPGPGVLTEFLLEKGAIVTAIEKDQELADKLSRFENKNLHVMSGDALRVPLNFLEMGTKVVANIPYHITTPIIERFITLFPRVVSLTLLVQHEVGLRMIGEINSSTYSSFTIFVNAYSHPHYIHKVSPNSFYPPPKIYSCIMHLDLHPFPFPFSESDFFKLTRTAFGKRRKMLKSSLRELYPPEKVEKALEIMGHSKKGRPQELSLAEFGELFKILNTDFE